MLIHKPTFILICSILAIQASWANPPLTQPHLQQGATQKQTTTPTVSTTITTLQQKHRQELAQQQNRLDLLEQANQKALTQNQELQLKNDNLAGQVLVLQNERSAQMFLYGAVTFGCGIFMGMFIYSMLYTRRRRF